MSAREPIRERRPQFWQVAKRCCQIAATVDVAFFFLFHLLGSPILAWVNVVSVTMYVVAYRALARKQNGLAMSLIWAEVIIHAGLGVLLIGWESGFHYFLLMFIPALFVSMALRTAVIFLVALWSYYITLYLVMWVIEPLQPIAKTAADGDNRFFDRPIQPAPNDRACGKGTGALPEDRAPGCVPGA
jgi:hypothetical protein